MRCLTGHVAVVPLWSIITEEDYFEIGADAVDLKMLALWEVHDPNIFHNCYVILASGKWFPGAV